MSWSLSTRSRWSGPETVGRNGVSLAEVEALRSEALRWTSFIVALGGLAACLWLGV